MKNRTFGILISMLISTTSVTAAIFPAPDDQEEPSVAASGNGYFVVWADKRNYAVDEYDIYGARVSSTGQVLDPNGIPICTDPGRQTSPRVAFNGNEYLIVWEDDRESTTNFLLYQIYGARVTLDGRVLDTNGFKITTNAITRTGPAVASDGNGFFAVWVDWDRTSNSIADIFGSPISADGFVANPDGIPLVQAPSWQTDPRIAFANGQYLVSYIDDSQIRGLQVPSIGGPIGSSFAISLDTANDRHGLASNGRDYFAVWADYRNSPPGVGIPEIYGTLIFSNGIVLNPGGAPISTNGPQSGRPKIASDGDNFFAVWEESNSPTNSDIYGARLTANGSIGTPARIIVNRAAGFQINADIAASGTNLLAAWQDGRSSPNTSDPLGVFDIYGTLVSGSGLPLNTNGFLISSIQTTNHAPIAYSQLLTGIQGRTLTFALTATDADNDPLTYRIVTPPTLGYLTGAPPSSVIYVSTTNSSTTLTDSFTFVANDGFVDSAPATISITLLPVSNSNNVPILSLLATDAVASEALNSDGTTNTATFSIQRSGNSSNGVPVSISVQGSAVYGVDYYTVPVLSGAFSNSVTSVTLPPGATSMVFTLYPMPDNISEGTEFAIFTIISNSNYTLGSPSQITVTLLDSNAPPVSGTRVIFPPNGSYYGSTLDIKLRIANTNLSSVSLYSDNQLLASFSQVPSLLSLVTNFSVGTHTIYSVGSNAATSFPNVTSPPVHFTVLAPLGHDGHSSKLGIVPEANASFFLDANGAMFDFGDGRYGALGDGGFTNQEQNNVTRPIQIPFGTASNRFVKISSGSHHTLALFMNGDIAACGDNSFGQTGLGHGTSTLEGFATIPEFAGWKDIAAGNFHSLALGNNGQLTACGNNSFGQLGLGVSNNTNVSHFTLVPFPTGVTAWTAIGAGSNYSIALGDNGQLYACGMGFYGTLGNGGATNSSSFVRVALPFGVTNWTKVFAGAQHVLATAGNGALYAWGLGSSGQLGNGGASGSLLPQPVILPSRVTHWVELAAGQTHSLGLADTGDLYSWGFGGFGQLGPGVTFSTVPRIVPPPTNVISWKSIGAGINHSLGIGDDCKLYSWGANNFGQLGIGSFVSQTNEVPVQNLGTGVCAIFSNQPPFALSQSLLSTQRTVLPITLSGSDPDNDPLIFRILAPPSLGFLTGAPPNVLYISTTNFLTTVTDAFTFVANDGYTDSAPATVTIVLFPPTQSSNTLPIVTITSTDTQASEFLNFDGTTNSANFTLRRTGPTNTALNVLLTATGTANYGVDYYTVPPLNLSPTSHVTIVAMPVGATTVPFTLYGRGNLLSNSPVTAIFTIGTNGGYTFGSPNLVSILIGNSNQPPISSTRMFFPPNGAIFGSPLDIELRVANTNIVGTVRLYADSNLLASTNSPSGNGTFVFSVITNFPSGPLTVYSVANNSITSAPVHFSVLGTNVLHRPSPFLGIGPAANSSFVVDVTGALFDWGDDRYGNLGDGGLTNAGVNGVSRPIQIPLPPFSGTWTKVASGALHTLALDSWGYVFSAGNNNFGQTGVGTNSTTFTNVVLAPGQFAFCKEIAAGSFHSLALTTNGQLYAWGYNAFGQLGLGNTNNAPFPHLVPFPLGVSNWTAIAAGNNHSLALDSAGNLYAWGSGVDGILGTGGTTNSSRPMKVVLPSGVSFWTKICAGSTHSMAIGNDGKLYAWGTGFAGQLGVGYATDSYVPIPVAAPTNVTTWVDIAAGLEHSLGIADNGKLYLWGNQTVGASLPFVFLPTPVQNPDGVGSWTAATAGWGHSLALGDNCNLYSIGVNTYGQLGIGSFVQQTNLQSVNNLGDLCTEIVVTSTNHAPSFVKGPDITVAEDAGIQVVTNWATQISPGALSETNQILTFVVTNDNSHLFSTQPGITASGNLFFAGAHDSNGVAHVTVVLKDNGGTANGGQDASVPQTFVITITPVNDPPVAQTASVTLNEDTSTNIHLNATDPDGDALTYTIVNLPAHGKLSGTAPEVVYLPAANYNGPDRFTFKVNDGQVDSGVATISITVLPVNDPPVPVIRVFPSFVLSSNYLTFQVISPNNSNAVVYFDASLSSDVDGDTLTFAWFEQGTNKAFGSTVVATNVLDIGTNWLTLSVSDGHDTVFQPFEVQVLSAEEAVGELIGIVQGLASHSGMKPNGLKQLLEPLDAARSEFDKGLWNAGIVHITIFESRVWAQIGTSDEAMANNLIRAAHQILDALQGNARNQPKLGLIQNRSGNRKSVTFSGSPGQIYLVQACSDLQHWETIGIASETDPGNFQFDDGSANAAARYYRLVVP